MLELTLQKFLDLIPSYVIQAAEKLQEKGYEAYLVGGSVRDVLLGKIPGDYDIATNAYPEEIEKIFEKSIPVGAKFGTIIVVTEDENGERHDIEITTYRSEADYVGGRWPSKVEFARTIEEDLERRDFTINAIALNLQQFDETDVSIQKILVDPFRGIQDLENKVIKAVRDPIERFSEDGLRAVRACRLASQLNFEIEENTFKAIRQTLHITKQISVERFREELVKLLQKSPKPSKGLKLMKDSGILEIFIPELLEGLDITQPQFHVDDVFEHSLKTCDAAEDSIKLAALFHDIGKPRTKSEDGKGVHFYGHDMVGAQMTKEIMKRLRFSNEEINKTVNLVRWHMFYYPSADWRNLRKLYVMRHGERNSSLRGAVGGQLDEPLNKRGIEQAEIASKNLSDIEVIYTSPLSRCLETAKIVNKKFNVKIITDNQLIERHFGELQGLTWNEFAQKYPNLATDPRNNEQRQEYLPSGESIAQVEERVKSFLHHLLKNEKSKNILIITHAGIIRVIKRVLQNNLLLQDTLSYGGKVDVSNGEFFVINVYGDELNDPSLGWSDGAIRRLIKNVGGEDAIDDLMKLRIADATANPKSDWNPKELDALSSRIAEVRAKDMALKISDLDISGQDLMDNFNIPAGKIIGDILNYLLDKVIDEPLYNKKIDLLRLAKDYLEKNFVISSKK